MRVTPVRAPAGGTVDQAGQTRSARIESLRGLAAVGVVVSHVYGWAHDYRPEIYETFRGRALLGGGFGVHLFFVLSGYLLYLPFARSLIGDGARIDLRRYARNRVVRVVPLYLTVLAVLLLAQHDGGTFTQWWRFALFLQNFSASTVGTVDGPMWSLAVEVWFYAALPLLAVAVAAVAHRSARRAGVVLVLLGLASLALRTVVVQQPTHPSLVWQYSPFTNFLFFVPGMVLALLRVRADVWSRPGPWGRADVWLLASGPLWLLAVWDYEYTAVTAVAGFLVVGACVLPLRPGPLVRLLDASWLAVLGVASFSLYLWHFPIVEAVAGRLPGAGFPRLAAVLVPGCCLLALVSYRLVEAPFLRLRRGWTVPARLESGAPDAVAR